MIICFFDCKNQQILINLKMVINVENVNKRYKKNFSFINALDNVSISINKGKIVGILGPNGAGKTTLLKIITGIINPDSGSVDILGSTNINDNKKKIGFLPENPVFFRNITAFELLEFSLDLINFDKDKKKIEDTIKFVGLFENRNEKVRSFSKGMVQRLGIAQAIIHSPEIIILDEPMSGLDPIGRKMVKDMILNKSKEGKTTIFSTHNLDDIESLCDEVIMIKGGKIVLYKDISSLRDKNSYKVEIMEGNNRKFYLINGKEKFWTLLEEIKMQNKEIISIKSDLSGELEQYYEK